MGGVRLPGLSACAVDNLQTSSELVQRSARPCHPVSIRLGGTTLWAVNTSILERGIQELQAAIEDIAASYLTIAKPVLNKLVRDKLNLVALEDRIFSAVLGAALRSGRLDSVVCSSKYDKPFWVYIHVSQFPRWRAATALALAMLKKQGSVTVRALEREIFGDRAYNTWSSSMHVLAQLSYRGSVRMADNETFALVDNLI